MKLHEFQEKALLQREWQSFFALLRLAVKSEQLMLRQERGEKTSLKSITFN